ncbi:Signal transduction histidine kinase [Amycolatopsis arida]|uniref:histidine kinase n=1 Tax=Amycolatopsis arida TaxID=587909 RepID=A0A1I5Z1M2_9PSEU|nr:sensor histidine kinase [Amycolatopsis arida]TDX90047.1 signal transduction histidine kinase [Amycolatopsis arida]SFQ50393.1 Signal transduction histidine kinase [Amycolatopsis arida]
MTTEGLSFPGFSVGGSGAGAADRARPPVRVADRFAWTRRPALRSLAVDVAAITLALLDFWLVIPEQAEPYSFVLSAIACLALVARRWFPFAVLLATVPGFLVGWSQLAAMIALGFLATRKQHHWQVWVGAGLVWVGRFVPWPPAEFFALTWREHVFRGIYGVIVAGMPVAIGLLIGARTELSKRLAELAASRDRERQLHEQAVRAEERARLAREMHDVVSHQITLIAMQAGALSVTNTAGEAQRTAQTIRELSKHTLEELRALVGVLRSGAVDDGPRPGIEKLPELVRNLEVPVRLIVEGVPEELCPKVSAAAYRTVQECLTNVHKHAPGAQAEVYVRGDGDGLRVEVRNAPADPTATVPEARLPSGGHGLTGLAERARLLGGTFETNPTPDGGFQVRARYPVRS